MIKSLFKYTITDEEYTFFYRDKILFKSLKNSPFIYLRLMKEGARKLLPFNEFEITKEDINRLEISFFATACVIKLTLTCDEKNVYFSFKKLGRTDDRLYIRLYKKNTRTVGLGLNEKTDFDKIKIGVFDKIKAKKRDKVYLNLDNTLNFYVINSYYFSNENINDWQLEINSAIIVSSKQESIKFRLEFNKRFNFLPQNNYKILKTTLAEQEKVSDDRYDAFIIDYEKEIKTPYMINKIRKRNKGVFIKVSPLIDEKTAEENYNLDTLIKVDGGYIVDITDKDNLREFSNYIREVLNLNPDGLYVDEYSIKVDEKLYYKNILFYENLHFLINKIIEEYPKKYVIFNKLNSSDKLIKKETSDGEKVSSLLLDYKTNLKIQKEIYSINYEDIKKKENVYINSLLFSGYKAYFYECVEEDVENLIKQGKTQLIVDNHLMPINKRILKKISKIKQ